MGDAPGGVRIAPERPVPADHQPWALQPPAAQRVVGRGPEDRPAAHAQNRESGRLLLLQQRRWVLRRLRTATSTSFWTISEGCLGLLPPHTRRGLCSTWLPCLLDADWCLRSDVMTDSFMSSGLLRQLPAALRQLLYPELDLARARLGVPRRPGALDPGADPEPLFRRLVRRQLREPRPVGRRHHLRAAARD